MHLTVVEYLKAVLDPPQKRVLLAQRVGGFRVEDRGLGEETERLEGVPPLCSSGASPRYASCSAWTRNSRSRIPPTPDFTSTPRVPLGGRLPSRSRRTNANTRARRSTVGNKVKRTKAA